MKTYSMEDALIAKVDFDNRLNRTLCKIMTYRRTPFNRKQGMHNDRMFMVYMLGNAGMSYLEIAKCLRLSRERVRQIAAKVECISRRAR